MLKISIQHIDNLQLFTLLIVLLLMGCKEEKDTRIPEITYISPQHKQEFVVSDTISVHAIITDETMITSVKVNLTDENFIAVSAAKTFFPNLPSYEVETNLLTDDESLESGIYYVLIRAENSENFKNKYQEISIQGLPLDFEQLVIVTSGGLNTLGVTGTEDFEVATPLFSITGDYAASEISSSDKLLFIAGKNNPNVHAYNLTGNALSWFVEVTPGKPMHNDGCLYFDGLLYTTYNYDFIHGYTPAGQIGYHVSIEEFDAPGRIFKHGDFILAEMQKKNTNNPYIVTYYALTGNEKQRRFMDFDVIDFYSMDEQNIIIVTNRNGTGAIYMYDVNNDILTFRREIEETINVTVKTGNETIILAGNSAIYTYNMVTDNLFTILNKGALTLAYEHLSGSLITGSFLKIDVYQYPEMVNQKTLLLSDTILDMHIQYSK